MYLVLNKIEYDNDINDAHMKITQHPNGQWQFSEEISYLPTLANK